MNDFRFPDDDIDHTAQAIHDFFDSLTEWMVEFTNAHIVPIMDALMGAVDNVAEAHGMTRDEFIAALQRDASVIAQIRAIDERRFVLEDDSARWN